MKTLFKLLFLVFVVTSCSKDIDEVIEFNPLPTVFRDYNDNSYNLRQTPLWIDHYSIPEQNNNSTHPDGYTKGYDVGGAIADFNNDGYYDILFAPVGSDEVETRIPIEIYLNEGDNETFTIAPTSLISNNIGLITARKTIIGDFNGDGKPDVFFADHGIHTGWPGGIPGLLLSNNDGYNFELTDLPRGFYHTTTSGDIDNDGDLDIYIPALENSNSVMSYSFLINDGLGNFVIRNDIDNRDFVSVTSELYDINNDGFLDLIIGTGSTRIFYGDGVSFLSKPYIELNEEVGTWEVYDFGFYDLDEDGYDDIIVSFANWQTNEFKIRIFKQNSDNSFIEKTSDWIENNSGQGHSLVWIRVQDIDNNGFVDIIENDKGGSNPIGNTPERWEWNGAKFKKIN